MFFINTNYKNVENKYEIQGNVALISLLNKKGSKLIAKIDVDDIEKVKSMGTWFAEWHKDFNSYLVQNISLTKTNKNSTPLKQNLQSVILNTNPKAPIKHINGDTLDNRKCNIEIVERNTKNDYEIIDESTIAIILKDRNGKAFSKALISKEDFNTVLTDEFSWVEYKTHGNIHVVANTPNGRIYLDKMLMNPGDSEIVHHINLNPLDCKRNNMEIVNILDK
ncbi:hypothetical protein [Clostridium hydrogenum]|uniref:hypothetical protein n=1 Tax=Clostridium hydrogenum TaxID=2855764 RepID=UPI002E303DFD|nr:hypothetical protein [Clostridium hydrogenum]